LDGLGNPCPVNDSNELCDFCSLQKNEISNDHHALATNSTIEVHGMAAASIQRDDTVIYNTLKQFLFNDESTFCRVCSVADSHSRCNHELVRCPRLFDACFRCLGEHQACNCTNQRDFADRTCYFCGLPLGDVSGKYSLHFGIKYGADCTSRARNTMLPGVWQFFRDLKRHRGSRFPFELHTFTDNQFASWLVERPPSSSMKNLCRLWAHILTK
jgi:hypothetical protein